MGPYNSLGAGGYYARIFLNVTGREPHGIIPLAQYDTIRNELVAELTAIPDIEGAPLPTQVFKPEEIYRTVKNIPPDLIVYFGNLLWRSVGSVGHNAIHTLENDTGPDDANHAQHGIFVLNNGVHTGEHHNLDIRDVAPTVLSLMNISIPADMQGRSIVASSTEATTTNAQPPIYEDDVYTEDEKKAIEDRLRSLGYL